MLTLEKMFSNSLMEKEFFKLLDDPTIKVVSFDIFDTLFFRKCGSAINIFEIMCKNKEIAAKFDIYSSFTQYRQNAEKNARRLHSHKEDITLEEIYKELPLTIEEKKRFQEIEILTEEKMLVVNHQLDRWIKFATNAGKKVILISDMYLSSIQIKEIALYKLKYTELIHKVYMSSEYQKTKATGNLFQHVLQNLNITCHELLHIGDNQRTDIEIANNFEIKTLYSGLDKTTKIALYHESCYIQNSMLEGSHVRTLATLCNPYMDSHKNFYFQLGASIFAPILWEFSHWLHQTAQQHNIKALYFIMREGAIFQTFFNTLYPKFPTKLLYASRQSTNALTLDENDIGSININTYRGFTLEDLYQAFFLPLENEALLPFANTLCQELDTLFLGKQTIFQKVKEDMKKRKETIKNALNEQKELLLNYLKAIEFDTTSSLIDFGGGGSILQRIHTLLPQKNKSKTDILFYQSARGYKQLQKQHTLSFLPYSQQTSKALESIARTPYFIEILLNSTQPTTTQYTYRNNCTQANTHMPKCNQEQLLSITEAFFNGIWSFHEIALLYKIPKKTFKREDLTLILARTIDFPTPQEVQFLGELEYDEGRGSKHNYKIIQETHLEKAQKQGIGNLYKSFLKNPMQSKVNIPWVQGSITKLQTNYLNNFYIHSYNPNQDSIKRLLEKLDTSKEKKIMIYGAGDFFKELLPYLHKRTIIIEAVIDSRAQIKSFTANKYTVITLDEAFKDKNQAIIIIASATFSKKIEKTIQNFAINNQKQITTILA